MPHEIARSACYLSGMLFIISHLNSLFCVMQMQLRTRGVVEEMAAAAAVEDCCLLYKEEAEVVEVAGEAAAVEAY